MRHLLLSAALSFVLATPAAAVVLWSQLGGTPTQGINSQNYETALDAYDDQAADDLVVPPGQLWTVKKVRVKGLDSPGGGPATSETVYFYQDGGGLPAGA